MTDANVILDFEKPVYELETELQRLRRLVEDGDLAFVSEVEKTEKRLEKLRQEVYKNLSAYDRVRLSRHLSRPFTLDYVARLFSDFVPLHGDRRFADDKAVVGGLARFQGQPLVVVGHQRGRNTKERMSRNFGMSQPEGNRKAQRLFALAEKFGLPLILFIDTQGAFPGIEAEARGQAEAIARSIWDLCRVKVPVISLVIGEGGSGGALALGVCDRLLLLENATYSVITPEGCASILWGKSVENDIAQYAATAADSLKLVAHALLEFGVADEVVKEPIGGAHKDFDKAADLVGEAIARHLAELRSLSTDELLQKRYDKFRNIGVEHL